MNSAQRGRRRALIRSISLGVLIALAAVLGQGTPTWRGIEERAQGVLVSLWGPRPWNSQVVVIEVDEPSVRELGSPIRREAYAQVASAAALAGARVLAFDVYMIDPSTEPEDDLALAGIAQAWGHVVLPAECVQQLAAGDPLPNSLLASGSTPAPACGALNLPAGLLRETATLAHVSVPNSPSGYFRGEYLLLESGGRRLPGLALAALARGNGVDVGDLQQRPDKVMVGNRSIPVDSSGAVLATYRGSPPEAKLSLRWLLAEMKGATADSVPASVVEHLKDKYVLLGQTAKTIGDHGPLITGDSQPLVYLHAAVLSDLIDGSGMREPAPWMTSLALVLLVGLLTALALTFRPLLATGVAAVLFGALGVGSVWLVGQHWLVAPLAPMLAGICALAGTVATQRALYERERQLLRDAFGSYVEPAVLDRVVADPQRYLSVDGAKKQLSVLVTDIKGYTGPANDVAADQVVLLVREYLEAMSRVIKKHEGRIDKITGDGIVAVFGDPLPHPDHALRAVTGGMEMLEEVARLQARWLIEGKKGIAIRIGAATGEVVIGNVGGLTSKIEYSALGPTVDLAVRLEGKAPAGGMLVAEETYQACREKFSFRAVQGLALKGLQDAYRGWLFIGAGLEGDPQRITPRLPTQAPVAVRLGQTRVDGVVENVSAGGLYVIAEAAVNPGDLVELEFAPVAHLVGSSAVTVRAQVRHVTRREDGQQGFGVQIERADAQRAEDLRHFVALYLGPEHDVGRFDSGADTFRIELGEAYGRLIKEEPKQL
jgi:class 3 adenylate cyclase/CHASE2 domain-containing sensor protein